MLEITMSLFVAFIDTDYRKKKYQGKKKVKKILTKSKKNSKKMAPPKK